ncbi:type VI secretion system tip protein VgrG [Massilia sp. TS11]|uniref:type VI secretion system tip protein VgrG n=1 Tax=Massilia sp. TS11 TaxID=2908003 RepID=UPI001EDB66EE|nr:type VI secretion system tip protein VgrG [Massilia sp. TS11]MCG2584159.1 type VI secretion system tip protein VgrG [Massilia sp. TS11]
MAPVSPLAGKTDEVSFTVQANGQPLPDSCQVARLRVLKQVNRIASARIELYDGSLSDESFAISSSQTLVPGVRITIAAGYHGQTSAIFSGVIVRHAIQVKADGRSYLVLTCFDQAIKLTIGRKSGYVGKSDSEAFSQIISGAGLTPKVSATTATHDEIVRYYATDWDFLVARAEVNGQIVLVDDGSVTVQAPVVDGTPGLVISYGDALYEINAEIDASLQLPSVSCSAWDYANQALASVNASEPSVNEQGNLSGQDLAKALGLAGVNLQSTVPEPAPELTSWANAQLLKSRLARIRGKVSFRGNATPKPGGLIEIAGCGDRFNGNAFIASVQHSIEGGNWRTEVGMGLSPRWFVEEAEAVEAAPASGLLPGVAGLVTGVVKQIDQDPDGETRVQVAVPVIAQNGDFIWARLASTYATSKAGIFFVPEVGDEVVLGFLNDDPRFPIVLGSLYNAQAHTPPFAADAQNTNKAIVTKNQLKITFDDVNKVIVVRTPGGQVMTMSDQDNTITLSDSNQNTIKMSSSGISLDSCAAISMSAKTEISMTADTNVAISATNQMSAKAAMLSASASASLSLQGDASAKLASSGETAVQGSLVMIN